MFAPMIACLVAAGLFCHALANRQLITEINPGCPDNCTDGEIGFHNLVYTRSIGSSDTLHHVWSTIGTPSMFVAQTSPGVNMTLNWDSLRNKSTEEAITFTEQPHYAFGVVFSQLWEFADPKDNGEMSSEMVNVTKINLSELFWQNISKSLSASGDHSTATFRTVLNHSDIFLNAYGNLALQLETLGADGRDEDIPRLLYSSNSSQIRFILDQLRPHLPESRFAVELTILATENITQEQFHVDILKTMDDEYTPGVFKAIHVLSEGSQNRNFGGYLSWKPVAYTTGDLSVTASTNAVHYNMVPENITDVHEFSVTKAAFTSFIANHVISKLNVSFGTSKDDFYANSHYSQWSFSYGLGVPGKDEISTMVKIAIASGLGLPMLLIILSCVYLGYHKMKAQKDDLLLSSR